MKPNLIEKCGYDKFSLIGIYMYIQKVEGESSTV